LHTYYIPIRLLEGIVNSLGGNESQRRDTMFKQMLIIATLLVLTAPVIASEGDHENVELVGSLYNYWDTACDVEIQNGYAYVATTETGLQVVDISNPHSPYVVGFCKEVENAFDVTIFSDYAYVTNIEGGYGIINISDPTDPILVCKKDLAGYEHTSIESDGLLFISMESAIKIFDLSDPENPEFLSTINPIGQTRNIAVSGDYVYMTEDRYLKIFDISDPSDPFRTGVFLPSHGDPGTYTFDVKVAGDYAYLLYSEYDLFVLDVSDPTNPFEVGYNNSLPYSMRITLFENFVFVSSGFDGTIVVDVSDPTDPNIISGWDTPGYTSNVYIEDDYAYVADGGPHARSFGVASEWNPFIHKGGFRIFDISDLPNTAEIGSCNNHGNIWDIQVSNGYAFLANGTEGLKVVDISDPENPEEIGSWNNNGLISEIEVSGNYAYLTDWTTGLVIIDISDPENLILTGTFNVPYCWPQDLKISGMYAYMVEVVDRMIIVDILDPSNPQEAHVYYSEWISSISISDNYAYLSDADGFHVIDITFPPIPFEVGSTYAGGNASCISGDNAYLSSGTTVCIIRPDDPICVSHFASEDRNMDIITDENFVYVANRETSLRVINVSDPSTPIDVGFFDTNGRGLSVSKSDSHVYLSDLYSLRVLDCSLATSVQDRNVEENMPEDFAIKSTYPNPFNPTMNVTISLPRAALLNVSVFNVLGKRVTILAENQRTAGIHNFMFDGSDLSSGVYFVHASILGELTQIQKVILTK
jgi:hypothetical protein